MIGVVRPLCLEEGAAALSSSLLASLGKAAVAHSDVSFEGADDDCGAAGCCCNGIEASDDVMALDCRTATG